MLSLFERLCIIQRNRLYQDLNPDPRIMVGIQSYDLVYDVVIKDHGELPIEQKRKNELWKMSKKMFLSRPKPNTATREKIYKSLLVAEYLYKRHEEGFTLNLEDEHGNMIKDVDLVYLRDV